MSYELECEKECPTCGQIAIKDKEGHYRPLDHIAARPEPSPNPWAAFLEARANAIDWLHDQSKSDAMIAAMLSMDSATQVFLIRTRDRSEPQSERE